MSDEMKNCCPPETTAPKMHVHEAGERTEDIKPTTITTAHKKLSQDEFQRKIAMAAYIKAAEDMEKDAIMGAAMSVGGRAAMQALRIKQLANAGILGKLMPLSMGWKAPGSGLVSRVLSGAKSLALTGTLPSVANATKTWTNLLPRMLVGQKGVGSYLTHPVGLALGGVSAARAAAPYVSGGLQRLGAAMGGTVGALTGGGNNQQGFGNVANLGLLGAGLGGVAGALMPGEEEYEDENGRMRKRRGSMLAGALRGAGLGGLAGGAAGLGMDHFGKMSAAQEFGIKLAKAHK